MLYAVNIFPFSEVYFSYTYFLGLESLLLSCSLERSRDLLRFWPLSLSLECFLESLDSERFLESLDTEWDFFLWSLDALEERSDFRSCSSFERAIERQLTDWEDLVCQLYCLVRAILKKKPKIGRKMAIIELSCWPNKVLQVGKRHRWLRQTLDNWFYLNEIFLAIHLTFPLILCFMIFFLL